jgi:hypothetical protein
MRAYKFLASDGCGVFSGFPWPLPDERPGAWVESEVTTCRAGVHACRPADLPYWVTSALYEVELKGPIQEQAIKIAAPRGRLLRRVASWDEARQEEYGHMCISRARELVASDPDRLAGWLPPPIIAPESARVGFVAARIAQEVGGADAYLAERRHQSEWLVEQLALA